MEMELMSPAAKSSSLSPRALRDRAEVAMLAAACGDALGWPIEPRGNRVGGTARVKPEFAFMDWERREGGGYSPFQRRVPAGTYSDDTQLILAVARSLSLGDDWWAHLTELELPLWTLYQLGGGGGVQRAARSWSMGRPPWAQSREAAKYFSAGANGVVMRILPHALYGAQEETFAPIARRIVADGITTHGHPRALVGALAAGYGTWTALRWQGKVGYGDLIERCLRDHETWSELPDVADYAPDWRKHANRTGDESYLRSWSTTVDEMLHLLDQCREAIGRGPLARDHQVLESLGVFEKQGGGAGTRTAAAALYFASRYVARPPAGLLAAAFARRSDTDTIACATGALLGALTGEDWIGGLASELQDSTYMHELAANVVQHESVDVERVQWTPQLKRQIRAELRELEVGQRIPLPVFHEAIVERIEHPETRSANAITIWWLNTTIGQHLAITDVVRGAKPRDKDVTRPTLSQQRRDQQLAIEDEVAPRRAPPTPSFWVEVPVRDLEHSIELYGRLLGIPVRRRGPGYVVFGSNLVLEQVDATASDHPGARRDASLNSDRVVGVQLRSPEIPKTRQRIADAGFTVSDLEQHPGEERFRVLDPDGNVIEVRGPAPA
jgi:ADP-ribosylglycohydrolase/catechol 2,3-dioxygenase-like lactoylglutathione lyase family enzyme